MSVLYFYELIARLSCIQQISDRVVYLPLGYSLRRVRNKANPFVRDMPKYLRTSQMSVHGYPADKSIFYCNLKLVSLKLQEETVGLSPADIDQDDVSLPGMLQGAVGRTVCYCFTPVFARRGWAIIRRFPMRQRPVRVPWRQLFTPNSPLLRQFK